MRVGIIGCGAIGTDVALVADKMHEITKIYLHDIKNAASKKLCKKLKKASIKLVKDFLNDVDFVIEKGEKIALVGKNGVGKSTLCRIVGGLEPATHGERKTSERLKKP